MAEVKEVLPLAEMKEFLKYNTDTGKFTWAKTVGKAKEGIIAGYIRKDGTRCIRVANKMYSAHYLAIYFATGHYPENRSVTFKHEDQKDNTRIENLIYCKPDEKAAKDESVKADTIGPVTDVQDAPVKEKKKKKDKKKKKKKNKEAFI